MAVKFLEPYMSHLTQRKIFHEGKVGEFEASIEAELVRIGVAEYVKAEELVKPIAKVLPMPEPVKSIPIAIPRAKAKKPAKKK